MPGYKGHLVGGSVAYLITLQLVESFQLPVSILLQGFIFCMLGSLFPDVDIKSKGQNLFYIIGFTALCYFLYYDRMDLFIGLSLLLFTPLLVKHRGIFHQTWFLIFISIAMGLLIDSFHASSSGLAIKNSLFFLVGAMSHIFLDRTVTRMKYMKYMKHLFARK